MESLDEPPRTGNVDVMDLIPCLGLCCCFFSFYTEMPDCLGTVCESSFLCFNNRSMLCKTGKEEEVYCKCVSFECDIVSCNTCCKVSRRAASYWKIFTNSYKLLNSEKLYSRGHKYAVWICVLQYLPPIKFLVCSPCCAAR